MVLTNLVLPILIGIVAAIALISILYNNPQLKQAFADISALIQLQDTSIPNASISNIYNTPIWMPLDSTCNLDTNMRMDTNKNILQKITTINSPLYTDEPKGQPIYNYYPKTPIV